MARVRIKHPNPNTATKLRLLRTLSENLIYATKIITTPDSYIVITRSDEEVDKLFQPTCSTALGDGGFDLVLPPELRAKRTIILFNVDDYILSHTEPELKAELLKENQWITGGIESVFKIPRTRMIKICLNDTAAARTATVKGLLAFHMSIASHSIRVEEFIPILTCMRCYRLEDHTTNNCPKPRDYLVCSECGDSGHTWKNCTSDTKKCLNCAGPHRTLAYKCSKRKEIKDNKRKEKKNTGNNYSQAVKANSNNNTMPTVTELFKKETATTILACIIHSHINNMANPGTYNSELNKVFKLNKIPPIIMPENPPSKDILSLAASTTTNVNLSQPDEANDEEEIMEEAIIEEEKEQEEALSIEVSGKDIGLQIITKQSTGWPKRTLYHRQILEGIREGKYKYIFTSSAYTEEQIYKLLKNNDIDLKDAWVTSDDSMFKKIRNGLIQEKTPPPKNQKLHKK